MALHGRIVAPVTIVRWELMTAHAFTAFLKRKCKCGARPAAKSCTSDWPSSQPPNLTTSKRCVDALEDENLASFGTDIIQVLDHTEFVKLDSLSKMGRVKNWKENLKDLVWLQLEREEDMVRDGPSSLALYVMLEISSVPFDPTAPLYASWTALRLIQRGRTSPNLRSIDVPPIFMDSVFL
jgi:hypothetical protein